MEIFSSEIVHSNGIHRNHAQRSGSKHAVDRSYFQEKKRDSPGSWLLRAAMAMSASFVCDLSGLVRIQYNVGADLNVLCRPQPLAHQGH